MAAIGHPRLVASENSENRHGDHMFMLEIYQMSNGVTDDREPITGGCCCITPQHVISLNTHLHSIERFNWSNGFRVPTL